MNLHHDDVIEKVVHGHILLHLHHDDVKLDVWVSFKDNMLECLLMGDSCKKFFVVSTHLAPKPTKTYITKPILIIEHI